MTKGFTWKPHLLKIIISVSAKWRPCWTSKFAELTFFYVSFPSKPYSTWMNFNYCFEFTMTVNRIQIPFSFFRSTPAWKEAWTWCCQAASGNTPHHRPLFHLLPGPSTPAQGDDGDVCQFWNTTALFKMACKKYASKRVNLRQKAKIGKNFALSLAKSLC